MSKKNALINDVFKYATFRKKCNFCQNRVDYYCQPYKSSGFAFGDYMGVSQKYFILCKNCFNSLEITDWLDIYSQCGFNNIIFKSNCQCCHNSSKQYIKFKKLPFAYIVCMNCLKNLNFDND